ncbi:glyoxalase [Candidatus Kaiserbacteria bacterium RIFCSPHIGHO2_02_FULL_49_34]|uniref:Glyoxalase n=1 Tax=Candidatus Kaiserbacteria bacterium RIFCSPHIGHO2_02_FULL_49_34 TaxID=1798491 RepID=A0A1F6DKC3_9BACT|nr:MAG: glyoxalase [Candidatus Kaiserbacteria bacterium RIFCSPHIGHO2_02_FULL_49_34]
MNKVVHFEIPSDDRGRVKKFYGEVFGWDIADMPYNGDEVYTTATTSPVDENWMHKEKGAINGALVDRNDTVSTPIVTIEVESIDEHIKKIEAAGGTVVTPKGAVEGMGFYAYFKDSEGNVMGLWENLKK